MMEFEKNYFKLFLNSTAIMLIINPNDFKIIYANKSACEFYKFKINEFKKIKFDSLVCDINFKSLFKIKIREKCFKLNLENINSFNEKKFVEISFNKLPINDSYLYYLIVQDFSKEKINSTNLRKTQIELQEKIEEIRTQNEEIKSQNEELINKNEKLNELKNEYLFQKEKYFSLFDNSKNCIAVYKAINDGKDFIITDFNKKAEELEKISKNDIINKKVTTIFPGVEDFGLLKIFTKVYKTGKSEVYPITFYDDNRIAGWRENFIYKLSNDEIVAVYDDVTNNINNIKQLEDNELKFRTIFNNSSDAILVFNDNLIDCNLKACEIYGYSLEEIKYKDFYTLSPEIQFDGKTSKEKFELYTKKALNGEDQLFTWESLKKDGTIFYTQILLKLICFSQKNCFCAFIKDINENKEIEEKLIKSKKEINLKNKIAQVMLSVQDENMFADVLDLILDESKYTYGLFGYINDKSDLVIPSLTRNIWDKCEIVNKTIIFEQKDWKNSIWGKALINCKSIICNEPKSVPKGHINIEKAICVPILNNGVSIGILTFANKDTDYTIDDIIFFESIAKYISPILNARLLRSRAENELYTTLQQLSETSEYLDKLITYANAPIIVWDKDLNIKIFNKAFENLTGYKFNEIEGKNLNILFPPNTSTISMNEIKITLEGKQWEAVEIPILTTHDEIRIVLWNSANIYDGNNNHIATIAQGNDITERKNAEKKLNELYFSLEKKVKERTHLLEVANKELESFSYSISHDLSSPLRSINGYGNFLLDEYSDILDDVAKDYIKKMINSSIRMSKIIDDLLNLSKITRKIIEKKHVNLSEIAIQINNELKEIYANKNIIIDIQKNIVAECDEKLLYNALKNLFDNAWKYTSKQEKAIIEFGRTVENNTDVFFVKDNGIGFDMNYSLKLFKPFQRLHLNNEYSGTGIGLAIVQRIINRHNGKIWVDSKENSGTVFYFTL